MATATVQQMPRRAGRWRGGLLAAFVALILVLQVAMPLLGLHIRGGSLLAGGDLRDSSPARFGWQMFTVASEVPHTYELLLSDGTSVEVDAIDAFGRVRGRMHYDRSLDAQVCALAPAAVAGVHGERRFAC